MPRVTLGLREALEAAVGERHVIGDPDVRARYETDWTERFHGEAACVVRPGSADDVAAVLTGCAAHGAAVVPQGGNTGLVGAGVPRGGEVVLSTERLDALGSVDPATLEVEAGAGVTLGRLQEHARAAGLDAGLDLGARDSATLGGIAATDAGGTRALRDGTARARVAGVQAVLADGARVEGLRALAKDNAGLDLGALLVGSEGTLGVITAVRWRLVPRRPARVAALVPLASVEAAASLMAVLRARLPSLEAADFFLDDELTLALEHLGAAPPLAERSPVYLIAECAAATDPTEELAEALEAGGVEDAVLADDSASRARLWRLRESLTEAINARGVPHKLDVGVPLARLAEFLRLVPEAVAAVAPGARTFRFGHLGDGNVHVNVLGPPPEDEAVEEAVLRLAAGLGGTISAEHGVGIVKARWLGLVRTPGEIAAMAAVKHALDPGALLNPGVGLPGAAAAVSSRDGA